MAGRMKKVSMQDIADRLGISKYAVSLALNGKPGVSEKTRERVQKTAQKLNYAGVGAERKNSGKMLVLIPEYIRNDCYFYHDIYWSIERAAQAKGATAILATISEWMQERMTLPPIYYEMDFLGLIVIGVFSEAYMQFLCRQTENIVSVDQAYPLEMDCVLTANEEGSYRLTRYVIGQGHRRIGFVGPTGATSSILERWRGYLSAMHEAGLPADPYSIIEPSPLTSLYADVDEVRALVRGLPELPTAWVCGGDRIAVTLIDALKSLGLRVPQDISVAGFDDIEIAGVISPALTTVRVRRRELGLLAVDKLLDCAGQRHERTKTLIHTDLVIRESVRNLADASPDSVSAL